MPSLSDYNQEFLNFNSQVWNKILESEEKYKNKNNSLDFDSVKLHFIDEILEAFKIRGTTKGIVVKNILFASEIDISELKDVSALCFGVKLSKDIEKECNKNDVCLDCKYICYKIR